MELSTSPAAPSCGCPTSCSSDISKHPEAVRTALRLRVNEMVAGIRADVGVKLFGDDFELLRDKAREIENAVKSIPGVADVFTEQVTGQPVLTITADRKAMARQGIAVIDVLGAVEALGTREVGALQDDETQFPIALEIDEGYRTDASSVGQILVSGKDGNRVPLSRLTHIETTEGPATINREWGKRRIVVQANVRGRDIGGFVADVERAIATKVDLPTGYFVRYGGQFEHLESARMRLAIVVPLRAPAVARAPTLLEPILRCPLASRLAVPPDGRRPVSLALIFALLYFTYGSIVDSVRVFTGVPFAAVGGVIALWLRDMPFSISAGVGFIALSGVSVLGDMVLVSTVRQRLAAGEELAPAIEGAALSRLRPVLMTALVACVGFLPMALNTGFGAEVQRPLATVVVGGVLSSTLLTLLVLPVRPCCTGSSVRDRRSAATLRQPRDEHPALRSLPIGVPTEHDARVADGSRRARPHDGTSGRCARISLGRALAHRAGGRCAVRSRTARAAPPHPS